MNGMMMLKVMVLGLGTVFAVLVLLILVIGLINKLIGGTKKENKAPVKAVEAPVIQDTVEEQDDTLVAVITAAVCAAANTSTHNFRVHSIRERKSGWARW